MTHAALASGQVALLTGAASGIGLAAATRFAGFGMKLVIVDIDANALAKAEGELLAAGAPEVMAAVVDVADAAAMRALANRVAQVFGPLSVLMNNAGREGGGELLGDPTRFKAILDTNLGGVVNGIQAFVPAMIEAAKPGLVINTGSKQGITTPPGDTAYNASKAAIKVVTEALAHDLRQHPGLPITAHLLIPGFTFTGFTRVRTDIKPDAAWLPEQVIDFMLPAIERGDFYILCPDNDVTRAMDEKRIAWAAGDLIENRPALSRWHPDYAGAFKQFMES
ncbi:short chain dehydrogenase [Arboricoccus pini]|uniref:Short chain dehydrogenase n=1 Tax=Arboricoccus pini TaxID=1963835 RepID=A0A212RZP5_9PROT|nr:SDR family NAD(P)-dependent oxidoreductase [Arboricoccus pini]SNB78263.1 short chain dehydrogenase [Arboricoccus pini]